MGGNLGQRTASGDLNSEMVEGTRGTQGTDVLHCTHTLSILTLYIPFNLTPYDFKETCVPCVPQEKSPYKNRQVLKINPSSHPSSPSSVLRLTGRLVSAWARERHCQTNVAGTLVNHLPHEPSVDAAWIEILRQPHRHHATRH